ncbi:MAG: class I adenylate-forming enzyme family protein [Burkholderiales bacterium]
MTTTREQAITELTAVGQPFELAAIEANGRRVRAFRHAPRSLRELVESTASDLPFLAYADERWTFAQAWHAAARIGRVLVADCGVRPGDRVAISMRNYPEWILAFTAITSIGAIAVTMNAHWPSDEMDYGLRDSGAKALLADAERLERLARCAPIPGLAVLAVRTDATAHGARPLASLVEAAGDGPMPPASIDPDDAATILYTSGSTGHPKGVVSTHRNILSALLSWELDRAIGERATGVVPPALAPGQDGTLLAVPLFHVTGLAGSLLASYRPQRRVVCMYRWDPEAAAALVERERLVSVIGPAAVTGDLLRVAAQGRHDLSSLASVGGGGAPRAPEQVARIDATLANALPITGWGMTETFAIGAGIGGPDYLTRPESSGRSSQVLALRVVDEHGRALPAGARGELQVRGASLFREYWNRPEATRDAFDGDWFRTGDMAYIDDEGFVFIVDRIKDLIIRGGENIGCGQVEAALLQHPLVHEVAVYAVPDERLGEEVGATVYAEPGLDAEALRAFAAERLAAFEVPRHIRLASEPLPRTATGKILKRVLREAARAG